LYTAALGIVIALIESRRHRIRAWTVALEFSFIWFVLFMIYAANFKHVRRIRGTLPNGDILAIISGAGAVVGFALFLYIVIRMARKRKPAVPVLLPVYVGVWRPGSASQQ
jgi:hypothetical protein